MEAIFEQACKDGTIAGMVVLASNRNGAFSYKQAFGVRSLDPKWDPPEARPPLEVNTLMRIASASKLITSIAGMQCVDRGLLSLDEDVRKYDPDLRDIQLLTGFDEDDKPVLVSVKGEITMRRLLSHSAGLGYDVLCPLLVKWRALLGLPTEHMSPKLADRYLNPLVSEPGTEWVYSSGIDWAGRIVEHVSGQKFDDYVQANIVKPLGLEKMTFFPHKRTDFLAGHADMTIRDNQSGKAVHKDEQFWREGPEEAMGGVALYTTPQDYFEVLLSLLRNDGRLLSEVALQEFLSPQLTPQSKHHLKGLLKNELYERMGMGGYFPMGCERDHSLAGMYLVEDLPVELSPRRPGTSAWMGFPNFYWVSVRKLVGLRLLVDLCKIGANSVLPAILQFIDPVSGICALFASQIKPSHDEPTRKLMGVFEKTIYERMEEASKR